MADAHAISPPPPAEIGRSRPKTCFRFLSHYLSRGFIIFSILLQLLLQRINVNMQITDGTREWGLDWPAAWPWGNSLFSLCLGSPPISSSYQDRDGLANNYVHSVYTTMYLLEYMTNHAWKLITNYNFSFHLGCWGLRETNCPQN